jgi:hypothetical protein
MTTKAAEAQTTQTQEAGNGAALEHTQEPEERTPQQRREALVRLLASWREGDEEDLQDQRETGEFLRKALDEDRPGYRTFFS